MTSSKQGFRFEHDVSNEIHEQTNSEIRSYRCGYSGNNLAPTPDVLITTSNGNYALELKKTSQEKGFRIESDDIQQLYDCYNKYTECWFAVKFTHRELLMFRLPTFIKPLSSSIEYIPIHRAPREFNPRVGKKSGDLLLDKPSLDEWPSSRGGRDDVTVIMDTLGINVIDSKQKFDLEMNAEVKA